MMHSDPFFFLMQNHQDQYEALDSSYTPAMIFFLKRSITLSMMPIGMGIFLCTHGVYVMVGILTGVKYSSWKHPHSSSVQARALLLILRMCWAS